MPRYIDADELLRNTIYNVRHVPYIAESDVTFAPTADVVERKDLDKITEVHEKIGYEKGYRDGYAQSIEDAIEVVGINTWAGSRITKLQPAQDRMVGKETEDE